MTKRLSASERRATILAVAKVLFADRGYHGVSVDEIARRLGVSPAILYRHFASKEALYEAVLNQTAHHRESYVAAVVNSDGSFDQVLRQISRIHVESVLQDPDYLRMEMRSALEGNRATQQFFDYRWRPLLDYIEFTIEELSPGLAIGAGGARLAALLYQGMLREALYAKCITESERYRRFETAELVDQLIDLFFRAIGYRAGIDAGLDTRP